MKLRYFAIAASLLVTTSGCASLMHGSDQDVSVVSNPAAASISVDGKPMGTTPAVVRLTRKESHILRLDLEGYQPFEMPLERKTSGWVWGNIVFGGLIGVAVDSSTGAMYKLTPGAVDATLATRTAVVEGRRTIQVAIVMTPDPSWEQIGQLSRD
jgi:hypothetical protein